MEVVETIVALRARLAEARAVGTSVGLVPTMGYLHDGHTSLLERAGADCDLTVATLFVNPLQFGPDEDLADYPRNLEQDTQRCERAGVGIVFAPSVAEMYPEPVLTQVTVSQLAEVLEGIHRPTHFVGVATVVTKLFAIVGACRAYFGEKDWQQLQIVTRLAADLSLPVEVVGCPTIRESDGLAMSSRNLYLDPDERRAAVVVPRALRHGAELIASGQRDSTAVQDAMMAVLAEEPLARPDYAVAVDARTLQPVATLVGDVQLLAAVRFGRTRLIDNVGVRSDP